MALPKNKNEFIAAIMLELGHPVLEINIDPNQIEHIVNKCVHDFQRNHYDGTTEEFVPYVLTQTDIQNGFLDIEDRDEIIYIEDILPVSQNSSRSVLTTQFIMSADLVWQAFRAGSIVPYSMMQQYRATLEYELSGKTPIRFNYNDGRVFVDTDWSKFAENDIIVLVAGVAVPETKPRLWSNPWLLEFTRWHVQMQWGQNLIKYNNVELPGGVVLNGDKIYEEAKAKVTEMEEKLKSEGQLPLDFFVG